MEYPIEKSEMVSDLFDEATHNTELRGLIEDTISDAWDIMELAACLDIEPIYSEEEERERAEEHAWEESHEY